jgi:hypothetical protein
MIENSSPEEIHHLLKEAMREEIHSVVSESISAESLQVWGDLIDSYRNFYIKGEVTRAELEELFLPYFTTKLEFYNRFGIADPENENSPQAAIEKEYSEGLTAGKEEVPFEPFSVEVDLMIESGRKLRIKTDELSLSKTEKFFRVTAEWVDLTMLLLDDLEKVDKDLADKIYSLVMAWEKKNKKIVAKDGTFKMIESD